MDPVEISIGDGEVVSSSMNVDTDERASAVPLSDVGNVLVGDVIAVTVGTSGLVVSIVIPTGMDAGDTFPVALIAFAVIL